VQFTSPSRRVFGILAAGTIGLSTALLGVTGVAQADPTDAPAATADADVLATLAAPYAPTMIDVQGDDATLSVWFDQPDGDDTTDWADNWEYNVDGGTWTPVTPDFGSGYGNFDITSGLTNGTSYAVRVRGVSDNSGNGTPSDPMSGTPYKPVGAPGTPTVVVGPSSLKVSWTAPTVTGTYPLAKYAVLIPVNHGQSGGPESVCETTTLSCTIPVTAGTTYPVWVAAIDDHDNEGIETDEVDSAVVPNPAAPATVPTKNGDLTLPAGAKSTVAPGKTVTVSGTGYAPFSTITLAIYSTPQVLTTVVTDASGNFTATVTVPAGLEAGNHTLVASGVDSSGTVRYVNLAVTVSSTGKASLAYTGADVALPSIIGLVAVSLGGGLIFARRRATRSAA
jgi:LPXTG-motif cell wall-anchored protein